MKLQLDENTLNAYINEAIRQELNESLFTKGASTAAKKIVHSPILKKITGRATDAKSARKFIMALRRGKPVEGVLETTGKEWRAVAQKGWKPGMNSKNVEFFVKDPATQKWVKAAGKDLALSKQSFSHHLANASNLFNSAQRNMLGTSLVAGMGAGWAIDHARNKNNPDAPWNNTPENGGGSAPQEGGFDGTFPWDNTTPRWSQRTPRRQTPIKTPDQTAPQPINRSNSSPRLEPVSPAVSPNIPTGVTQANQSGIVPQQQQASVADRSKQLMAAHVSDYSKGNETYGQAKRGINRAARSAKNVSDTQKPGVTTVKGDARDAIKNIRQGQ